MKKISLAVVTISLILIGVGFFLAYNDNGPTTQDTNASL